MRLFYAFQVSPKLILKSRRLSFNNGTKCLEFCDTIISFAGLFFFLSYK